MALTLSSRPAPSFAIFDNEKNGSPIVPPTPRWLNNRPANDRFVNFTRADWPLNAARPSLSIYLNLSQPRLNWS